MTLYWLATLIVWGWIMAAAAKRAYRAAFNRHAKFHDSVHLAIFLVALLFFGQVLRWLFAPENMDLWKALYVIGAVTGFHIGRLMRAYARRHQHE